MRLTQALRKIQVTDVAGPRAPFKPAGRQFDELFVPLKRLKKAWDGQDKDQFFRDKYAHVHAKQMQQREELREAARRRREERPVPRAGRRGKSPLLDMSKGKNNPLFHKPQAQMSFAELHAEKLRINWRMEFTYGTNASRHVLQNRKVDKLFTSAASEEELDPTLWALCQEKNVPVEFGTAKVRLDVMSAGGVHNGCVLQTEKLDIPNTRDVEGGSLGLYLDRLNDPHNIGAIMRTAKWYNCDFVMYPPRNSASVTPAVVKASSGATEHLKLGRVFRPLKLFENLRARGWSIVTTLAPEAKSPVPRIAPEELHTLRQRGPVLLVLGNESDGVRTSLAMRSTHATYLRSDQEHISSLNVSVAASVLLDRLTAGEERARPPATFVGGDPGEDPNE